MAARVPERYAHRDTQVRTSCRRVNRGGNVRRVALPKPNCSEALEAEVRDEARYRERMRTHTAASATSRGDWKIRRCQSALGEFVVGLDLAGYRLAGADLRGANLSYANLE